MTVIIGSRVVMQAGAQLGAEQQSALEITSHDNYAGIRNRETNIGHILGHRG